MCTRALSSRFSYLNFKECALGSWSSRFSCSPSSNSNELFALWTWSVVNGKNVNNFDHLYLDASCLLDSLYYVCFYELSFNICFPVFGLYLVFGHMWFMLGTYVTILCNWLILWQNALYLQFGRSRMCLILQKTRVQV